MHKVFVYGSLKMGFGNHSLLNGVGEAKLCRTKDSMFEMGSMGGFPGVSSKGGYSIEGELYEVDDKVLGHLDMLEGNGHFYTRELVEVQDKEGEVEEAWMYLLPHAPDSRRRVLTNEDTGTQTWVN